MNNREVMQKALGALEHADGWIATRLPNVNDAIAALRAALAEPQEIRVPMIGACQACGHEHEFPQREPQEPGAPFLCRMGEQEFMLHYIDGRYSFCTDEKGFVHHPVPQRQPLPKHDQHCVDVPGYGLMATKLVRAVERAHGIGGQDE